MTPAARIQAAIEILEVSLAGTPTEQALTNWARRHRFAGSGDRAAIRDHVFDAIRCRRSYAARGGMLSGRGLMIGALRSRDCDPDDLFTGSQYAPETLSAQERDADVALSRLEGLDCPDWIAPDLEASLGPDFEPVMLALRSRAPVFLRVNTLKGDVGAAMSRLRDDGVETVLHPLSGTALEVTANPRRVRSTAAYQSGLVELQDASSQAVVDGLPDMSQDARILDYCAGGGGKTLAMAARFGGVVHAHDGDPGRMADLPERARRAGAMVRQISGDALTREDGFDLVLCDVPCSGSGAWRRQPDAKWTLTRTRLDDLKCSQASILDRAQSNVAPGGSLAYATCSLLDAENQHQIEAFRDRNPCWSVARHAQWTPLDGGDGFGVTILTRN
jgi:16S rRNA (cytosine967-C5)-methyltransferase